MAGVLDGVLDEDMRLAIAQVMCHDLHFYMAHDLFVSRTH
jgi:hypothetical protein